MGGDEGQSECTVVYGVVLLFVVVNGSCILAPYLYTPGVLGVCMFIVFVSLKLS